MSEASKTLPVGLSADGSLEGVLTTPAASAECEKMLEKVYEVVQGLMEALLRSRGGMQV